MNIEWVKTKETEYAAAVQVKRTELVAKINSSELLTDEDKKSVIDVLDKETSYCMFDTHAILAILSNHNRKDKKSFADFMDIEKFLRSLNTRDYYHALYMVNGGLKRYLDSEPIEFNGDIIITDPCYIMRAEHHGTVPVTDNDWDTCEYGNNMETLGIQHYMTRDTIYGDWGCTVYDMDTKGVIGNFCADAGLVSVLLLGEVL